MKDLHKINAKVFLDIGSDLARGGRLRAEALDSLLPIFARWREERDAPYEWVDLADYAHMSRGPGVMIIGHRGNLALDLADPGPGILYANKSGLDGPVDNRVRETFRRALELTGRLVTEAEYPRGLVPRPGSWQLVFNDRLAAPNTEETESKFGAPVRDAIASVFGSGGVTVIPERDPGRRYGFTILGDQVDSLDQLARQASASVPPVSS